MGYIVTNRVLIVTFMPREPMETIRVLKPTKLRIKKLAEKLGLKEVTTLEYLLTGKIELKELI